MFLTIGIILFVFWLIGFFLRASFVLHLVLLLAVVLMFLHFNERWHFVSFDFQGRSHQTHRVQR